MRISDWSSDVCSSDLPDQFHRRFLQATHRLAGRRVAVDGAVRRVLRVPGDVRDRERLRIQPIGMPADRFEDQRARSEEHTSELQSLMRISYAVFCLTKTTNTRLSSPTQ